MGQKLNYQKTLLLGFGFFAISLTWALYNAFVPAFLDKFIKSSFIVGFIMTLDNYAGIFLQPLFGTLSDKTRTRFGRRMPYLIFGMPIAAVMVSIIPHHWSLVSLMISIVLLNLVMASFRSPTIALMPDFTPEPLRSKANGIINLMGGIGGVIAFLVGSKLYKINNAYPFYMASALIVLSLVILVISIKEERDSINYNERPAENQPEKEEEVKDATNLIPARNVIFLLIAIFFWFVAYNAVESHFTRYGIHFLGVGEADAAGKLTYFSLLLVVFAVPAGFLATKIGRKKTIIIGLVFMILSFGGLLISSNLNTIGYLFMFAGASWALININSYPFVVSMTNNANIGRYTGYYYFFSSLAAIVSPPLAGLLLDWIGFQVLFIYSVAGFAIALIFMLLVKPPEYYIIGNRLSEENAQKPEDVGNPMY